MNDKWHYRQRRVSRTKPQVTPIHFAELSLFRGCDGARSLDSGGRSTGMWLSPEVQPTGIDLDGKEAS
jgi:hypothetical protein